jgi:hypothetical protein
MPRKKLKPNEKPQRERFIEAARGAGADESGRVFKSALDKIVPTRLPRDREKIKK